MTELEILQRARDLIAKPENWTQGAFARDASDESVTWTAPDAVCFCIAGAMRRAAFHDCLAQAARLPDDEIAKRWARYRAARKQVDLVGDPLPEFNDSHTHAEVLELLDRAIARLTV